ncbi:hypothetical protein [Psychromicrobium sp. YIM B11713]|uniref:hypothetical protein n=1 Tax=Psychromicrobium sp. YIM B11713 TaxID=3145233 RepID=UPI00374E85B9
MHDNEAQTLTNDQEQEAEGESFSIGSAVTHRHRGGVGIVTNSWIEQPGGWKSGNLEVEWVSRYPTVENPDDLVQIESIIPALEEFWGETKGM